MMIQTSSATSHSDVQFERLKIAIRRKHALKKSQFLDNHSSRFPAPKKLCLDTLCIIIACVIAKLKQNR